MDLLATLSAARVRAAASPGDPAAWAALAEVLDVADRGALDADAGFQLATDRWEALDRLVALVPTVANLRTHCLHVGAIATRARERGHPELAFEARKEQAAAARVWMRVDPAPAEAAEVLVEASQGVAEHAAARSDAETAAAAFTGMLEGLYLLAERTGRPEYALRIAGVELHVSYQLADPVAARAHLAVAVDLLDRLDAAGLSHPVQTELRAEVEARIVEIDGS